MNSVILCGRLTKDPDGGTTQNGHTYSKFSLAVDRVKGNTDFIDCIAWDKTAELTNKYLVKGRQVIAQGSLQIDTYTAKDGTKRTKAVVSCERIEFVGGKEKTAQNRNEGVKHESMDDLAPVDVSADDMPF